MVMVMRIKEMINNESSFLIAKQFSLPAPWDMYKERCGEYVH